MKTNTMTWIIRLILLAFAGSCALTMFTVNGRIAAKQTQKSDLQAQINAQLLANQEIEANLTGELTDEEIAAIAREKLGFSLPGERIFVDITGK